MGGGEEVEDLEGGDGLFEVGGEVDGFVVDAIEAEADGVAGEGAKFVIFLVGKFVGAFSFGEV